MKNILVLGGSGFIGKNIVEKLSNDYNIDFPNHTELDVLNEEDIYNCLKKGKYNVIINALDIQGQEYQYFEKRLRMFCNLEKYSSLYGKMIFFGSGAEYGREMPIVKIREKEFDRIIPSDTYGFCLREMSKRALVSENIYNFRLFGIFGKYELWERRFISNAICRAMYNLPITIMQNRVMDYLFIDDLIQVVKWAIENTPIYHDYNLVSGNEYKLTEIATKVRKVIGNDVPIIIKKQGLQMEYTANNDRLRKEFVNFKIQNIENSIEDLSNWYLDNKTKINKDILIGKI